MALGLNDFDAGNIPIKDNWTGWALKIETFLGPEMATSETSATWAKKARFSGPISNGPSNGFTRIKIIKSKHKNIIQIHKTGHGTLFHDPVTKRFLWAWPCPRRWWGPCTLWPRCPPPPRSLPRSAASPEQHSALGQVFFSYQCCGTVTTYYGSGSDFSQVKVPVPAPYLCRP